MISIRDADTKDQHVLIRLDVDVPIKNGKVVDDTRLKEALPTLKQCSDAKRIVMMGHLGRPKGKEKKYSLAPVAKRLSALLNTKVTLADALEELPKKKWVLLENLRFHEEEKGRDKHFAKRLASFGDMFVNESFANMHHKDASVVLVPKYLPSYIGIHAQEQIHTIQLVADHAKRPFFLVLGGAKIDKLVILKHLVDQADAVFIGGAMMFTFLKAQGYSVGKSMYKKEEINVAKQLLNYEHLLLPEDVKLDTGKVVPVTEMPKDRKGLDIGPSTIKHYQDLLKKGKTIIWNGPLGMAEKKAFAKGTEAIATTIAKNKGISLVGGGDTILATKRHLKKFTHYSSAGGAFLALLSGKPLPGLKALD